MQHNARVHHGDGLSTRNITPSWTLLRHLKQYTFPVYHITSLKMFYQLAYRICFIKIISKCQREPFHSHQLEHVLIFKNVSIIRQGSFHSKSGF